jgi:transcription antitermination protein NusB
MDPRHKRRVELVQQLYSHSFDPEFVFTNKKSDIRTLNDIVSHVSELDDFITKHAPKYPVNQIAKTDLAILRLSIYELIFKKKEPSKVIINEAVELAKEMGSDRSYAFVNAVLGAIVGETIM